MADLTDDLETRPCRYGTMSYFKNDTIISRSLRESGEWAQGEIDLLYHLINSKDTVLDVGAFIGTHTLAFSRKVGGAGRVYAFEPQPTFFEVLKKNIEQNALTNVRALGVALGDRSGRAEIREIDASDTCNFGETSVSAVGSAASDAVSRRTVGLITVDQLALDRCDLIKIDAEGMEIEVLRGAQQTLCSMRPVVSAECNSLEHGWPVAEFLKDKRYCTYSLNTSAYNPGNFRQNTNNFLGDGRETCLILIPAEKVPFIQSSLGPKQHPSLIPIACIDDLALVLLKKPQYKYEVMSKAAAASVLGVEFWANEPEVKRFQQTIHYHESTLAEGAEERSKLKAVQEGLSQQLIALQAQLVEREQRTTSLSEQLVALQAQLMEREQRTTSLSEQLIALQAQLVEREQRTTSLSEQLVALQAQLVEREQRTTSLSEQLVALQAQLAEREATIMALLSSSSWQITRPLRGLKRMVVEGSTIAGLVLKRVLLPKSQMRRAEPISDKDELLYSIDSLRIKAGRVYGFGWAFHKNQKLASVKLVARVPGKEHKIPACYGCDREDVVRDHSCANAQACGFWLAGKLPFENPTQIFLQVETETGEILLLQVSMDQVRHNRKLESLSGPFIEEALDLIEKASNDDAFSSTDDGGSKADTPVALKSFLYAARNSSIADRRFVLVIDHNLGGGANRFRRELVTTILEKNRPVLLLSYDLPTQDYVIGYIDLECKVRFRLESPTSLLAIAEKLGIEEIFCNTVYSFEDPLAIAELLPTLKKISGARLTVAIHDYFPICPSFTLIDDTGTFCGVPDLSRCERCLPSHRGEFSHLIDQRDIRLWRHTWGYCLAEADMTLCFSDVSARLVSRAYPELDQGKLVVRPHRIIHLPERKPFVDSKAEINIGVVGEIAFHKGASLVADLATYIEQQHLAARITIIGTISPRPHSEVITVTGPYQVDELPDLIEKYRVNLFLFPSIWPETFSYVCEELMRLEVPLAVYDIGAPAERVASYGRGLILRDADAGETMRSLFAFHNKLRQEQESTQQESTHVSSDLGRGEIETSQQILTRPGVGRHKIHVFTGVALDHLHRARILCESLKRYHPDFAFHVALADKVPSWLVLSEEPFDSVIGVESLDIPNPNGWIFSHNITELCTAIKPFVLRRLLDLDGCQQVYFFDADIVLFSRIDDLIDILDTSTLILTPHQTTPETALEAIIDNEICSLRHGIYNLGFLGVRNVPEARRFTDWWAQRLYYFCREALDMHLWTDQKWINHVPVFFEQVHVVKSPRFNVAPWNITTRKVEGNFETGFTVNGEPLAFYHFTGFDSGAHKIMATKYAPGNSAVESLIRWYEQANHGDPDGRARIAPWAYATFENGEPITELHRSIYRMRKDLQEAYPNPFKSGKNCYYDWLRWRAATEYPQLFGRPSSASAESDLISGDHELFRYLLDVIDTLKPQRAILASFARLLLLAERYRFLTWFHYRHYGLKQVLELARKRIRRVSLRDESASARP
jgi:FkbM family methyltransferase